MNSSSIYGAFNARWLSPEDVARALVPTSHLLALVRFQHSLLMGPRGCGKTTLLKMLTRPAQNIWTTVRLKDDPSLKRYPKPDFEAIYIPSDVRWSYELSSVEAELKNEATLAERVQRACVGISTLLEATKAFQIMLGAEEGSADQITKSIISHFNMGRTVPSFRDIKLKLLSYGEEIRSSVVRRDISALKATLDRLPPSFTAHALDTAIRACTIFEEFAANGPSTQKWALCFDELEIAPRWLQLELLRSLRSFDQHFLLKLTWSPVLPTDLAEPQERHDFAIIRMWHAHAAEAKPFCREFSTKVIRDRFGSQDLLPKDVFGVSPFGHDDEGTQLDAYAQGSETWKSMVELARMDRSYADYLIGHHLDPGNPVTESGSARDEVLRKVKPIVLLREAELKQRSESRRTLIRRSRKIPSLYYGEETIYSMSEGNPRLLAGLLNELFDAESRQLSLQNVPRLRPETQARVLFSASQRMLTTIKAYPVGAKSTHLGLYQLVERLGIFLNFELVGKTFNADPVGSFTIDENISPDMMSEIAVGLLIGAFVHVGSTITDVPHSVLGARIRLSHMLAPSYRLLFRNFRPLRLSSVLRLSEPANGLSFQFER